MVAINLLPWRERQSEFQRQQILFAFAVVMLVVVFIILSYLSWYVYQKNNFTRQLLQNRARLLRVRSQASQNATEFNNQNDAFRYHQRVLAALQTASTFNLCISALNFTKTDFIFAGMASSSSELSAFLQTASLAAQFSEIQVVRLQAMPNGEVNFTCRGIK